VAGKIHAEGSDRFGFPCRLRWLTEAKGKISVGTSGKIRNPIDLHRDLIVLQQRAVFQAGWDPEVGQDIVIHRQPQWRHGDRPDLVFVVPDSRNPAIGMRGNLEGLQPGFG